MMEGLAKLEQTELDLREIMRVLHRRWWVLILLPTVAMVVAALVSTFVLKPSYEASTTIWVVKEGANQINYNDLLLNHNLTKTYAEVAKSRAVMKQVIETLHLKNTDVVALQNRLTVTPVRDTEILSFTVEDPNPVMAAQLIDAVAEAFKDQIGRSIKVDNVTVVDPAIVPTQPIRPRPLLNTALAGVLGLMAALGLIFLIEYLDTSIKSPDDVAHYLDLPVLGAIPVIEPVDAPTAARRSRPQVNRFEAVEKR
jgi:capsular polysaccharide biosynthesis protein